MKKHNFNAGPTILPDSVLEKAAASVIDLNGSGLSILEVSHRGADFTAIIERAEALTRQILDLPDDYAVLFLSGGASSQFFMTAMNLLDESGKAYYVDTGSWSSKAIKEARLFGQVEVLASSKDRNYSYIPKGYEVPSDGTYLHLTSNNTIFGTQFHEWPESPIPVVCDMSSDIFSRPIDLSRFDLIYAGAQKNLGPAGTTLVIVRKELLGRVNRQLPSMLDYRNHIDQNSCYNTPPVFPIYVCMLTLEWILEQGGLSALEERNRQKAELLYRQIDVNPLFRGVAETADRSWMNVTFVATDPEREKTFLKTCQEAGCVGVKGHRSVGGFRASIYNAMPLESVRVLAEVMEAFAHQHA